MPSLLARFRSTWGVKRQTGKAASATSRDTILPRLSPLRTLSEAGISVVLWGEAVLECYEPEIGYRDAMIMVEDPSTVDKPLCQAGFERTSPNPVYSSYGKTFARAPRYRGASNRSPGFVFFKASDWNYRMPAWERTANFIPELNEMIDSFIWFILRLDVQNDPDEGWLASWLDCTINYAYGYDVFNPIVRRPSFEQKLSKEHVMVHRAKLAFDEALFPVLGSERNHKHHQQLRDAIVSGIK